MLLMEANLWRRKAHENKKSSKNRYALNDINFETSNSK